MVVSGIGITPGIQTPASKYGDNTGWVPVPGSGYSAGSATVFNTDYGTGHILIISNISWTGLTPKDAWSIDKKIDDGKPGMGNVILYQWATCTNAANKSDLTATYTLTVTSASCGLFFIATF